MKIKKALCVFLGILFALSVCACGKKSAEETIPATEVQTTAVIAEGESDVPERILSLLENYAVSESNGFDWSSEKTENGTLVGLHTVSVRLDHADDPIGSMTERIKKQNKDAAGGSYTESTVTAYYRNGKIRVLADGESVWQDGAMEELYSSVKIGAPHLDVSALLGLSLTERDGQTTLTFGVADGNAAAILGVSQEVRNLTFEIVADESGENLLSYTVRYEQDSTVTVIRFVPYTGAVGIILPD